MQRGPAQRSSKAQIYSATTDSPYQSGSSSTSHSTHSAAAPLPPLTFTSDYELDDIHEPSLPLHHTPGTYLNSDLPAALRDKMSPAVELQSSSLSNDAARRRGGPRDEMPASQDVDASSGSLDEKRAINGKTRRDRPAYRPPAKTWVREQREAARTKASEARRVSEE